MENPNVVVYNKFKDKGFTILGVSYDQDKTKWLAAIKKIIYHGHTLATLKDGATKLPDYSILPVYQPIYYWIRMVKLLLKT